MGHRYALCSHAGAAGSEKYRSITTSHYRNAAGAVIVYDITSADSFYNCKYWYEQLVENCEEDV